MAINDFTGPIPGENYTSDTKNYPWHRPPEFTNIDKAIEMIGKKLLSEGASSGVLTMLEMKMTVAAIVDTFLTSGIGAGKWTPDFALLLAGPTSHIICLMAEGAGIEYDLGIEDRRPKPTSVFFKKVEEKENAANVIKRNIPSMLVETPEMVVPAQPIGGFMNGPPPMMGGEPPVEGMMKEEIV